MGRHIHVYKPLADERAYIRLVLLQPGTPSDEIHIYLQDTPQHKFTSGESGSSSEKEIKALSLPREKAAGNEEPDPASYEALSYIWGDQKDLKHVNIGSYGFKDVGMNLEEALRHLRHEDEVRVLWIDALSINQDDDKEKSAQVPLMEDIFRSASRVIMWLGPERDESTHALDLMRGLGSNIEVDWFHIKMKALDETLSDPSWTDEPFDDVEPHPLHALFMRPWFDRLWIRQVVFLASSGSILCCGLQELDWSVFCKAVFRIAAREIGKHRLGKKGSTFLKRVNIIVSICSPSPYDILQLRQRLRPTKCKDPRDYIYGVLNIMTPSLGIKPDYGISTARVYEDVFMCFFSQQNDLSLLLSCDISTHEVDRPSWVPNWSAKSVPLLATLRVATSGGLSSIAQRSKQVLSVKGAYITTVQSVTKLAFDIDSDTDLMKLVRHIAPKDVLDGVYPGGWTLLDAFCYLVMGPGYREEYYSSSEMVNVRRFADWKQIMLGFLRAEKGEKGDVTLYSPVERLVIRCVQASFEGHAFFTTEQGYIGIAPETVEEGDHVCVLAGVAMPMLLRMASESKQHDYEQVVGACMVPGLLKGEGLLGPVPEPYRLVWYEDPPGSMHYGFLNVDTQKLETEHDPRIGSVPLSPSAEPIERTEAILKMMEKRLGLQTKYFHLV